MGQSFLSHPLMDKESLGKIVPVVLCGGVGARLAPLSTPSKPKPFLKLCSDEWSMLQQTIIRVSDRTIFSAPILVINERHQLLAFQQMKSLGITDATIIAEPMVKNTAPAIAIASHYVAKEYGDKSNVLVLPADHYIEETYLGADT